MIGQTLSHYRILSRLGSGGMGVVYEAEDVRLGRRVAVKVLPADACCDAEAMERFTREARIVSSLNHPHICMLFDVGEHDGGQFMVMEKLEGELLRSALARGPLPLDDVLELGCHAASALSAAHARNVIHRDIKPANLFVTPHGLKVLDFGVAKLVQAGRRDADLTGAGTDDLTRAGTALGTVAYMSPEQARGQEVDARSDLFSLGCVLYEMATGAPPFTGPTTAVVFEGLLTRTPEPPSTAVPTLPAEFDRIALRALQKDPAARYATAAELQADLQRLQRQLRSGAMHAAATPAMPPTGDERMPRGPAAPAAPTSAPMPAAPQPRGHVARRALFVGAPLALAAGIAAFVFLQTKDTPALSERDPVVLAQFVNRTGDAMFDDTLSEALALQLRQSPFLNVLSEQQVQTTLRLMNRGPGTTLTPEIGREVCQRAGAKAVLNGTIAGLGSTYVITLGAQDCVTGDSLAERQVQADRKEDVLKVLGSAVGSLRTQLGESLASVQRFDTKIEEATTPSLEALKAYSQGTAARRTEGDRAALPYYRRAIELDPDFALAHARLGTIYSNIGDAELARTHTRRAYELRQNVSERERLYIEGRYFTIVERDLARAAESYRVATASFPTDYASRVNLAALLRAQGLSEDAVPLLEAARRIAPEEPLATVNLAGSYLDLERFADARRAAEDALRLRDDGTAHRLLAAVAVLQDDAALEAAQVQWAERRPGDPEAVTLRANLAVYRGRVAEAVRHWEALAALLEQRGLTVQVIEARLGAALVLSQVGQTTAARTMAARAQIASPVPRDVADEYLAYAWGIRNRAAAEAAQAAALENAEASGNPLEPRLVRALSAGAAGDAARALELLGEVPLARTSGGAQVWVLGALQLETGRLADAVRTFEWVRDNPLPIDFAVAAGVSRYLRATALQQAGRTAEARTAYQEFLEFWKNADPDLPIVQDAKKRLAQLGT